MSESRRWSVTTLALCVVLAACTVGPSQSGSPEPTSPYRQTLDEFLVAMAACLQEKGYNARVEEGGLRVGGAYDRETSKADFRACEERIDPARLLPPLPLTRSQLEALYRYVVAQTECMREAGYPVSDPPPLQVFVDSEGSAFDPYGDLRQRGIDFSHEDLLRCQDVEGRPGFLDW
jgi:hypothetical protein